MKLLQLSGAKAGDHAKEIQNVSIFAGIEEESGSGGFTCNKRAMTLPTG